MAQKEIIGSGGCFPQYAQVLTTVGYKNISEIVVGDEVISYNDTGRLATSVVEAVYFHKNNAVSKYNYWGGVLYATPNHWVLNQLNSFSEIGNLSTHDCLVDVDNTLRPMLGSQEYSIEDVYNLSVVPDHTYIVDGIRVHNGGGGKGGGGASRPAVEDPNTLRSKQFARVLDLLSEGEIGGLVSGDQSIFVNDVPLQNPDGTYNFKDSYIEQRTGTQTQPIIQDLNAVEDTINVSTQITRPKLVEATYPEYNSATTTIVVTLANHGFLAGQTIYVCPLTGSLPENTYVISTITVDTFKLTVPSATYPASGSFVTSTPTSSIYVSGNLNYGIRLATHTASVNGTTKTINKTAHGFAVGESVYIWGGSFPLGAYQIASIPTTNTFTVNLDSPIAIATSTVFISRAIGIVRTVSNIDADECYLTLEVPQLTNQDTTTGDLHGSSVSFVVNVKDSTLGALYTRVPLAYNNRKGTTSGTAVTITTGGTYTSTTGSNSVLYASPPPINSAYTTMATAGINRLVPLRLGYPNYAELEDSIASTLIVGWRSSSDTQQTCSVGIYKRVVGSSTWILHATIAFNGKNVLVPNAIAGFGIITYTSVPTYTTQSVTVTHPAGLYEYQCAFIGTAAGTTGILNSSYSTSFDTVGSIVGKTLAKYQKGYTIPLAGVGPWQVQIIRVEEESIKANISNQLWWSTYTEVVKAKLNYPNSAMMYCAIDAEQFSSIPSRSYEIYGIKCKIPSNYNPYTRKYTGFWDGTFVVNWTDNPAWVFYDLVTNTRYGLGDIVSGTLVDKWTLYSIGQYCDGSVPTGMGTAGQIIGSVTGNILTITNNQPDPLIPALTTIKVGSIITGFGITEATITALGTGRGGLGTYTLDSSQTIATGTSINVIVDSSEPRFSCNLYLQTREDAYKVVSNLASIFRGMVFWSTGLVTASQDAPKSVDAIYTAANVIDGTFTYTGTSAKTRHNVVLVSWNNPKNGYAIEIEYVQDEAAILANGIIQTEVSAMGCTSQGQAHRLGKWILYTEQYETETVSFQTGLDGLLSQPGDIIQTQDPFRSGTRLGGRVASVSYAPGVSVSVTIDNPITFTVGKTYTALFTKDDGTIVTLPLSNTLNNLSQDILTANTIASLNIQVGSVWVVSVSTLDLQSWRVVSVAEPSKGKLAITALSYNGSKFNNIEYNHRLQSKNITKVNLIPDAVTNIVVQEHMYLIAPAVLSNILSISWDSADPSIDSYLVTYKNITTNSNETIVTSNLPNIEISPIMEAQYSISVQAVNALGTRAQKTEVIHTVVGKTVNPADITKFSATLANDSITLNWSALPDLDIDYYEVRYGTWGLDSATTAIYKGVNTTVTLPKTYVSGMSHLFYIKAKDTSGNWSASYTLNGTLIDNTTAKILLTQTPAPSTLPVLVTNSVANVNTTIALPSAAINAQTSLVGNILKLSWTAPTVASNQISTYGYRIYVTVNAIETIVAEVTTVSYDYLWADTTLSKSFRIETIDNTKQVSATDLIVTKTFTLPNVVTGVTSTFSGNKLILTWTAPIPDATDTPTKLYRIYLNAVAIAEVVSPRYEYSWTDTSLSKTFSIETVDILNNVSPKVSPVIAVIAPVAPTNLTTALFGTALNASWTHSALASNSFPIAKYNIYFGDVGNAIKIGETVSNTYSINWIYGAATKALLVEAIDINGNISATRASVTTTIVAPNAPSSLTAIMKATKLLFSWNPATVAVNSLPIDYYELREGGTSWTDATFVANIPSSTNILQYLYGIINTTELATTPVGILQYNAAKIFRIATKDVLGVYSLTHATFSVTLTKPSALSSLSLNISGSSINAAWTSIIPGILNDVYTLPIDRYEIRATRSATLDEATWNNATSLASLSGSAIALDPPKNPSSDPAANADGTWYYLIRAWDSFNIGGALFNKILTITKPSAPATLTNKVIDNNILLNWTDPLQHSFPIATFMLKKSFNPLSTYTAAQTIGTKSGNFTTVFEESSGSYSYFLTGIDTAGNIGTTAITNAVVNQPPDYVLNGDIFRDDFSVTTYGSNTLTSTQVNVVNSNALGTTGINKIIGPMSATQTFASHFTDNAWASPQAQVTAGYPIYAQPSITSGSITEVVDYGIIFNTNQYVSLNIDVSNIAGTTGTYQIVLSTSTDGITYAPAATSAVQLATNSVSTFGTFALNFRYVKVQIILAAGTPGIDLIRINSYRLRLSLKYTNDGGSGTVGTSGIYQINLSGGGASYTSAPTVTIGGSGTGASAKAVVTGGVVTSIIVTNSGTGYSGITPSNITITGGGGSGCTISSITLTSASSGSIVSFNYAYLDINMIQVAYGSITPGIAIYDFVDIPYPTSFRVLLFDTTGNPITGNFSWSAKGTI